MQFPKHQMCHNYDELLLKKLIANFYLYYHFYFTGESLASAFQEPDNKIKNLSVFVDVLSRTFLFLTNIVQYKHICLVVYSESARKREGLRHDKKGD